MENPHLKQKSNALEKFEANLRTQYNKSKFKDEDPI